MSSDRIDHVAKAHEHMKRAVAFHTIEDRAVVMAQAQTHATLALVEQQRIANLIALGEYENSDGSRLAQHAITYQVEAHMAVNEDIREALGL